MNRKVDLKICIICNREKHISKFYKNSNSVDGLKSRCILCYKTERYNFKSTIANKLGLKGMPTDQIPPELIELKMLQLKIKRELKKRSTK
jgi:hypothetical protein